MLFDWRLRGADGFDLPFLEQVFVIAADWNPATAKGAEHWTADPTLEKYLGSWRTGSDFGFVIDSDEGPIGAVWMRYFTAADASYGFVDEQTPELTIGVLPEHRGRGAGRMLLQTAQEATPARLSLSVEDGNRARALYEEMGFVPVGRVGGSTTMLWHAPSRPAMLGA